jgi:hypothetical protein
MEPSRAEIDHMLDLVQEFQQILKEIMGGTIKTREQSAEKTQRVKEIGDAIRTFKMRYPKCKIH